MELTGKTAIVTGSGRGIGKGIAIVLAREGANVVVVDRNLDDARNAVHEIEATKGTAMPVAADVTKKDTLEAMAASAVKQYGTIDILVNNAGVESPPVLVQEISEAQWDRVLGVNLKGVFLASQSVVPAMIQQKKGRIINIGSIASIRMTFQGGLEYTVSKHGVAGFTQHLAWELADHNITVNTVCPGAVLTAMTESGSTPEFREMLRKRLIPLGRPCTIEEIGEAVSFLASDRASMITGQMLPVDGGLLTGYGEDMRAILRQRMETMKAAGSKR